MRWTKLAKIGVAVVVLSGTMAVVNGCGGIPKGTMEQVQVGQMQITAVGAGIVMANAQKTTFRIKPQASPTRSTGYAPSADTSRRL